MARGINKVTLIGNLGKDPEVQTFDTYKKAAFSLATTEYSRDKEGNEVQHTEWHNIVMWRGLAEIAEQYLRKGNQVYIEGKIRTRSFDAKDGTKKYITEIQADNLVLLGGKRDGGGDNNSQAQPSNSYGHPAQPVVPPITEPTAQQNDHDDLPF
ncbi:MAG: single-stranded DNA-binding protein [Bacteroidales bacterium]|nr:single-stranded DNA-binding protein [Bacteroidales bacterium]